MSTELAVEQATDEATWASLLRERFVALDVHGSGDALRGDVTSWTLGHLQLSEVRSLAQDIERSSTLVRTDHRAYLQVGLVRAGEAVVRQDGREALLGPGDFVVYETTRPFRWSLRPGADAAQWQLDVLTWPRSSIGLGEADSRLVTATAMDGSSGLSAIISRMLRDLMTHRPEVSPVQSTALADEIGDLLTVLTRGVDTGPAARRDAALLARIDAHIEERLADPGLDPASIARAHAVSVRQLHRLFADRDLTVTRSIRARRLEHCRRDLVSPATTEQSVAEVARRWGFADAGAFGRAFRETYGVSPGSYRLSGGR